jgi:hypothetical protein
MAHIYENGTRAWQPDPTDGWVASEVVEKKIEGDKVKLVFQLENGEVPPPPDMPTGKNAADDALRRKKQSRRPCPPSRRATTRICPR